MSTFTPTLNLEKPSASDNVLLSVINSNYDKIDANASTGGGYKIGTLTYVGDGQSSRTWMFEHTPLLVLGIYGRNFQNYPIQAMPIFQGCPNASLMAFGYGYIVSTVSWSGKSLTISGPDDGYCANGNGKDGIIYYMYDPTEPTED